MNFKIEIKNMDMKINLFNNIYIRFWIYIKIKEYIKYNKLLKFYIILKILTNYKYNK